MTPRLRSEQYSLHLHRNATCNPTLECCLTPASLAVTCFTCCLQLEAHDLMSLGIPQ